MVQFLFHGIHAKLFNELLRLRYVLLNKYIVGWELTFQQRGSEGISAPRGGISHGVIPGKSHMLNRTCQGHNASFKGVHACDIIWLIICILPCADLVTSVFPPPAILELDFCGRL